MTKLLITGATGYIGGSVLTSLLTSANPQIRALEISALVRKQEQADLLATRGVKPILFSGLDDTDALRTAAAETDVIINTASAANSAAAAALIEGLAQRKQRTGTETHLIHTSGTSSLGDRPITKTYTEPRVFSDKDDIYSYQRAREDNEAYVQRTTDLVVFENGEKAGVKTYILMSPTIYGIGSGLFNTTSIQIDGIIRAARKLGYTPVVGPGAAEWDHVHVADLADLYELLLGKVLAGEDVPANKDGIYFNETGHHPWREISDRVAKAGKALGYLPTDEVREVSLQDWEATAGIPAFVAELAFASRSRTQAVRARELGWAPKKTRKDFEDSFVTEWKVVGKE